MPSTRHLGGLIGPATPFPASPDSAAVVRMAHFGGSTECHILPVPRTVFDQSALDCCVSCAVTAAVEMEHPTGPKLAAIFHYHAAKFDASVAMSGGSMTLDDGFVTLAARGVCDQSLHTAGYTAAGWETKPSAAAYTDALTRRLPASPFSSGYFHISHISRAVEIRDQLKRNRPVVIGFTLPQGYKSSVPDASHTWDDPNVALSSSAHCVLIFGFDDVRSAFRVQDSQGTSLFEGGRWWMGYNVADSPIVLVAYAFN